jgi:hypothetical protein
MRPREALGRALRDFYEHSWLLLAINATLGVALVVAVLATLAMPLAVVAVALAGPLLAAVVHCAVTLQRTGNLAFADAWEGLRVHWRHGLVLAFAGAVLFGAALFALRFYGNAAVWPLAFLSLYVLVLLVIYELVLWTVAIAEPEQGLRRSMAQAAGFVASRPFATLLLGLVLLLVNIAGIAAAVMPFLTLTVAYTFLATAHFVLPPTTEETT